MTFLTQVEAEIRLANLRERRDELDRNIADCLAFLELGRRLQETGVSPRETSAIEASSHFEEQETATSSISNRQHGRAMMAACMAILREAQRPMHAGEVLEKLRASGFEISGLDPVASLNTRLWKRSGSDGSFRRLGDAVYALADVDEAPSPEEAP